MPLTLQSESENTDSAHIMSRPKKFLCFRSACVPIEKKRASAGACPRCRPRPAVDLLALTVLLTSVQSTVIEGDLATNCHESMSLKAAVE